MEWHRPDTKSAPCMYLPGGGGEEHSEIVLKKETTRAISVAVAEKFMTSFLCVFVFSC